MTSASVNFLTCHDGFTLYDLYSYNAKHNEKNGWNNTDGDNNGNSWNCGVEGETDDPQMRGTAPAHGERMRLRRCSAAADRRCSTAGDEFCNTQFGNNNAYCQDNIISWLDWTRLEKYREIHDFVRYMIDFRKALCHSAARRQSRSACQFAGDQHSQRYIRGTAVRIPTARLIGIMYAGRDEQDTRGRYCVLLHECLLGAA